MEILRRAAVVVATTGVVLAGSTGVASANSGCTGVAGQDISHSRYFCNGFGYEQPAGHALPSLGDYWVCGETLFDRGGPKRNLFNAFSCLFTITD